MRQVATLQEEQLAQRLADYLLTLEIETRILDDPPGWGVWVCDEKHVERAKDEVASFQENPTESRFVQAQQEAHRIRGQAIQEELAYQERQQRAIDTLAGPPRRVTVALIGICILVFLGTEGGEALTGPLMQSLFFAPFVDHGSTIGHNGFQSILSGQVWRLVTPIFLHFDIWHLVFNMILLFDLGGMIERRRSPWVLLALVLLIAVVSNVAEYYVAVSFARQPPFEFPDRSPLFGGISGVVYGLFGYCWMKSRHSPELEIHLSPLIVLMMMGWFFLCLFGVITGVANVAHGVGLLVGVLVGYLPVLFQSNYD